MRGHLFACIIRIVFFRFFGKVFDVCDGETFFSGPLSVDVSFCFRDVCLEGAFVLLRQQCHPLSSCCWCYGPWDCMGCAEIQRTRFHVRNNRTMMQRTQEALPLSVCAD